MSLQEKINQDWMQSMKARTPEKDVLALVRNELKNKAINERSEGGGQTTVSDDVAVGVLQKMAKQRKESIISFEAGGRLELAKKEAFELSVIESYLPKQLSDDEIRHIVQKAIQETSASSLKELGKVMGVVLKETKGRADGKHVQEIVKSSLQD